jgi:undecaprenyl-diphosphatase
MKVVLHQSFKKTVILCLLIITSILLCLIVWLVFFADSNFMDERAFVSVTPHITQTRTLFLKTITFFGNHQFLIPANLILIALLVINKEKWKALTTGVVALSSLGLMSLLKNLIKRIRPPEPLVDGITNFSFPSGHAFMSVAFYGLLIWLSITFIYNKWLQRIVISVLFLIIIMIGFSRVYLRLHYLSDVIAGACIGTIWLILCISMMERIGRRKLK